jgi:hypothetical protein
MSQININPIGVGLPSQSVQSLGEEYLRLASFPKQQTKEKNKQITFTRNRWYNIPYNENGRKAPTTIHRVLNGKGGIKEVALFTNNISSTNRKPTGEKWTPNNARRKALNLQNELAKNKSRTRKIRRARK